MEPAEEFVCLYETDGGTCSASFDNFKSLQVHRTSHRTRECRWCGEPYGIRGLDRHEAWCSEQEQSGLQAALPAAAWTGRFRDFMEHSEDIPAGCVLVIGDDFGPSFVRPLHAAKMVAETEGPMAVVPSALVAKLSAPALRLRRRGRAEREEKPKLPEPLALPELEEYGR